MCLEARALNVTWCHDFFGAEVTFSGNVHNGCRIGCIKFGGAARRRFYAVWKQFTGVPISTPAVRGLRFKTKNALQINVVVSVIQRSLDVG